MKNVIKKLLIIVVFASSGVMAEEYDEGMEYIKLDKPVATTTGDKVEVRELFWYGCPHCYHLEPTLNHWLDNKSSDSKFVRQPAIFSKRWGIDAVYYYTMENLGILDTLHEVYFKAIQEQGKKFNNKSFANWVAGFKIKDIDAEKVAKTLKSFAVQTKVRKAAVNTGKYKITGVPSIVVAGKYITDGPHAGDHQEMMKVVDYLVKKERAETSKQPAK